MKIRRTVPRGHLFLKNFQTCFSRILRYEEFAVDIWNQTNLLHNFLGIPLSFESREYLLNHTKPEMFSGIKQEVWNTYRDPKKVPFHWVEKLSFDQISKIQNHCQTAMKLWGYKMASYQDLLNKHWNPLTDWQITTW